VADFASTGPGEILMSMQARYGAKIARERLATELAIVVPIT
jgi:hypothetical protein